MDVDAGSAPSKSASAAANARVPLDVRRHAQSGESWTRLSALLVGAGLFSLTFFTYRADIREARERVASGSTVVTTRCGPIEYAEAGAGPPVLVVHGAGGGYDQGLDLAGVLARSGFRVIAMSRFGYLRTPLPADASPAAQADAHACLLDALDTPRTAVLAASAGAPSAMQFALRHPKRTTALVLLVPAAYAPRIADEAPVHPAPGTAFLFNTALKSDFVFWATCHFARTAAVRGILATPPQVLADASSEERARVYEMLHHILPVTARRRGLANDAKVTASPERYALERIAAPTLVISMADDLYGTFDVARYTAGHIPHGRLLAYATGGHVAVGRQRQIMSEIATFLKAADAGHPHESRPAVQVPQLRTTPTSHLPP
jgi:pimeloyl-ACP methyl ester carboxylesterase